MIMEDDKNVKNTNRKETSLGILQWFHVGDYELVDRTIEELNRLNIRLLRTGISWADYHTRESPAISRKPVTIYGDGLQVRDILYVSDLVNAFSLALQNMDRLSGKAYNIGGGVHNAVSLKELISLVESINEERMLIEHADFRIGDQFYYVSDTSKFRMATGWNPTMSIEQGLDSLYRWLWEEYGAPNDLKNFTSKAIADD